MEKNAFIVPQGLFEFQFIPFRLMNAPSVFQRLMTFVLMGLNPKGGPDFVAVYIDNVLVFSQTLEDDIEHLKLVVALLQEARLKLKPSKCHFVREEVGYLGHKVTPSGLKQTAALTAAVMDFPAPRNVKVRQFMRGANSWG